ncbi:MAG: DUF58 domain-containing protein [Candidatus Melainabacteria bacterium]|nr:DUF58 domain-containing protein [Candidatus Melainabacteria bacterium]
MPPFPYLSLLEEIRPGLVIGLWLAWGLLALTLANWRHDHPTPRLLWLLGILALLPLLALGWPPLQGWLDLLSLGLASGLWLLLLLDALWTVAPKHQIQASVDIPQRMSTGQTSVISLQLSCQWPCSGDWLLTLPETLREKSHPTGAFRLRAEEPALVTLAVTPKQRGVWQLSQLRLRIHSQMGLLYRLYPISLSQSFHVYPNLERLRQMRLLFSKNRLPGELRKRKLASESTRFDSLRNYSPGEDVRKIDWKATARLDTPVIRTFELAVDQPVAILVNVGRQMLQPLRVGAPAAEDPKALEASSVAGQGISKPGATKKSLTSGALTRLDVALNTALAFAAVCLDRGDPVGFWAFHQHMVASLAPRSDRGQLAKLMETMLTLDPSPIEPDYEGPFRQFARQFKQRSTVVVLTDLSDPAHTQALLDALPLISPQHLVLVVTLKMAEPPRRGVAARSGEKASVLLAKAYAHALQIEQVNERTRLLTALQQKTHAIVIDSTPEQLDEHLIHTYLSAKLKASV